MIFKHEDLFLNALETSSKIHEDFSRCSFGKLIYLICKPHDMPHIQSNHMFCNFTHTQQHCFKNSGKELNLNHWHLIFPFSEQNWTVTTDCLVMHCFISLCYSIYTKLSATHEHRTMIKKITTEFVFKFVFICISS